MTNFDPFGHVPRSDERDQFHHHGDRSTGVLWPLLAVIGIILVAGVIVSA